MSKILDDSERDAIIAVAGGDKSQLASATQAYNRAALAHGVSSCTELMFMAEVLAPVPDLLLRAHYRRKLLGD